MIFKLGRELLGATSLFIVPSHSYNQVVIHLLRSIVAGSRKTLNVRYFFLFLQPDDVGNTVVILLLSLRGYITYLKLLYL